MTLAYWLILFLAAAGVLLAAELLIPSHGLLTILGSACLIGAIVLSFMIDRRLGLGVLAAVLVLTPLALTLSLQIWQRTPVGRRLVLRETVSQPHATQVLVGTIGTAMTELRPMGECEWADVRFQAYTESGQMVPVGTRVKVLSMNDGVAVVRPVESA
jgi:membrane-bound ClpP family serine protease